MATASADSKFPTSVLNTEQSYGTGSASHNSSFLAHRDTILSSNQQASTTNCQQASMTSDDDEYRRTNDTMTCHGRHQHASINLKPTSTSSDDASFVVEEIFRPLKEKIEGKIQSGEKFFSLEFFPPKNKNDAVKLLGIMNRLGAEAGALFVDVTWHPAGNPAGDSETSSMTIANAAVNYLGIETVLHVTCLGKSRQTLIDHLDKAKKLGVRNILALRGDATQSEVSSSTPADADKRFKHAIELVRLIRKQYGDYFSIGVAGYPRGHPEARNHKEELEHLKQKVEAGADFIITQLFFRADDFITFVMDCRRIGIEVPIIPGVMPIQSYQSLRQIARLTQLDIPHEIILQIEKLKGNSEAIKNYGAFLAVEAIQKIFLADAAPGVHFYTMNREVVTSRILKQLGFWNRIQLLPLPWQPTANYLRRKEDVRPIFWNERPRSYVFRTKTWKEFPSARWGNSKRDKFGDLKELDSFFLKSQLLPEQLLQMWGESLTGEKDVWKVFERYVLAEPDKQGNIVSCTPWSDHEFCPDVFQSQYELADVCSQGILVVKSQRALNGWPSDEPTHGWGPNGGRVFQKEYVEFFTSSKNIDYLLRFIRSHPTLNYHIMDKSGTINLTNLKKGQSVAAAWGIFPGCEVVQPVIVDRSSFEAWKHEAFSLWTEVWANLYSPGSESRRILNEIADTYILVYLLDEDFTKPSTLYNSIDGLRAKDREKFPHQRRSIHAAVVMTMGTQHRANHKDMSHNNINKPAAAVADDVDHTTDETTSHRHRQENKKDEIDTDETLGAVGGPAASDIERERAGPSPITAASGWEFVDEQEDRFML